MGTIFPFLHRRGSISITVSKPFKLFPLPARSKMQSVIFDPLLRATFECQHRSLSAGWHVRLLRRKSWCYDISSVVWKSPREGNGAAWKCHMGFHSIKLCTALSPLFSTKNKLFTTSQTVSLFVSFSWYIFSIAFRQILTHHADLSVVNEFCPRQAG